MLSQSNHPIKTNRLQKLSAVSAMVVSILSSTSVLAQSDAPVMRRTFTPDNPNTYLNPLTLPINDSVAPTIPAPVPLVAPEPTATPTSVAPLMSAPTASSTPTMLAPAASVIPTTLAPSSTVAPTTSAPTPTLTPITTDPSIFNIPAPSFINNSDSFSSSPETLNTPSSTNVINLGNQ